MVGISKFFINFELKNGYYQQLDDQKDFSPAIIVYIDHSYSGHYFMSINKWKSKPTKTTFNYKKKKTTRTANETIWGYSKEKEPWILR